MRNDYKQFIILEDLSNREINRLRVQTFEVIDIKRNLKLEEFMMARMLSLKINLFQAQIHLFLKKQQQILEKLI